MILGVFLLSACDKNHESIESITYPEAGGYGQNILADDFLTFEKTDTSRIEYSVKAELPVGSNSNLKIVIKSGIAFNQGSEKNWFVTNKVDDFTFTSAESGTYTDASIIFVGDSCTIEYYENGAIEPTKVKVIKAID